MLKNWVHSRHKSHCTLSIFEWRYLPKEYPSYDSAGPLKPIVLSQYAPKSSNLDQYLSKDLYLAKKKLIGEEPIWRYKPIFTNQEKERYISPFSIYPNFELYNGIKYGQIIPNCTTHLSSKNIKNKRDFFTNLCDMKHQ